MTSNVLFFAPEEQLPNAFDNDSADASVQKCSSRDSLDSLLSRGRKNHADIWDEEGYRFSKWWDALDADTHQQFRAVEPDRDRERQLRYDLYRHYASERAQDTIARALEKPFVVRHAAKQEFVCLYMIVRCGVRSRDGTDVYFISDVVAARILSCLGYLKPWRYICPRQNCINFRPTCPLFEHRTRRSFGDYGMSSPSASSEESSSELSYRSTGSVDAVREGLSKYISKQSGNPSNEAVNEKGES
eukprot:TRINITY_DN74531_c0_g1_i1.p1 TRINITY_DN74531_c0_g1~~TRINITY_DN74531_c0_g1_i1.p1  ORF type:complete len:245 (-),score=19.82 TRINITY_DN74531_c0_g1_i1:165-899(-)